VKFCGAILGLEKVAKPADLSPSGGVWLRTGDLEVDLGMKDQLSQAVKAHPAFLAEGLETLKARIEAAGYRVTDTLQIEGFHRMCVRGSFGSRVELIEPA
jgi:hypothetical protein